MNSRTTSNRQRVKKIKNIGNENISYEMPFKKSRGPRNTFVKRGSGNDRAKGGSMRYWKRKVTLFVRERISYLNATRNALNTLYCIREGTKLEKTLGLLSVGGELICSCGSPITMNIKMREDGYERYTSPVEEFVGQVIYKNIDPEKKEQSLEDESEFIYYYYDKKVAVIVEENSDTVRLGNIYVYEGDDTYIKDLVAQEVWKGRDNIKVKMEEDTNISSAMADDNNIEIEELIDNNKLVGSYDPKFYADRLSNYRGSPRTVLFEGCSGVGKSVLAIKTASYLSGHGVLKVVGTPMERCDPTSLPALVELLEPSVVLIDDVNILNGAQFLEILEMLRVEGVTTILTRMVDRYYDEEPEEERMRRGSRYIEGMRPGRVDEIFTIYPPNYSDRLEIIGLYEEEFGISIEDRDYLAKETEGLTGAYIKDIVRRISAHGQDSTDTEIKSVMIMAPPKRGFL